MTSHVIKGGSFRSGDARRISYQEYSRHTFFLNTAGFRVCRVLSPLSFLVERVRESGEDAYNGSGEVGDAVRVVV